ncbi:hypothetical protein BVG81_009230 [Haliangium sp. UPWRP_2]|nr:hypothetical protein BVG81_009230 [Haliangium sp. UPWRP_2]
MHRSRKRRGRRNRGERTQQSQRLGLMAAREAAAAPHLNQVTQQHWLSREALLDAVAIGQITPGPVFTTATCIGYFVRGAAGAGVATLGIFAPSFALVWLLAALLLRLRQSRSLRWFLDGVNACSLAVLAATACLLLAKQRGSPGWLAFSLAALLLGHFLRLNPSWLILAGALAGALAPMLFS